MLPVGPWEPKHSGHGYGDRTSKSFAKTLRSALYPYPPPSQTLLTESCKIYLGIRFQASNLGFRPDSDPLPLARHKTGVLLPYDPSSFANLSLMGFQIYLLFYSSPIIYVSGLIAIPPLPRYKTPALVPFVAPPYKPSSFTNLPFLDSNIYKVQDHKAHLSWFWA